MRLPALPTAETVMALLLGTTIYVLAGPFLAPLGYGGLALLQILAFATPALLIVRSAGAPLEVLGLVRPRARALVGALLLGASMWCWVALWIAPLGANWGGARELQKLSEHLAIERHPLGLSLLVLALLPGICEELLHRGVLARHLASRFGLAIAIAASALFFGASHLSLPRLLPTAALGAAAAYASLVGGSLWPAMVTHLSYNACLLLASGWNLEIGAFYGAISTGVSIIGLLLIPRARGSAADSQR